AQLRDRQIGALGNIEEGHVGPTLLGSAAERGSEDAPFPRIWIEHRDLIYPALDWWKCEQNQPTAEGTLARGSAGVRPALGEGQRAGAEGPPLPLTLPGSAGRLHAIARQPRAEGWDEHGADAVAPPGHGIGLGVDQQRIANVVPGEGKVLMPSRHPLGPKVARVAVPAELGIDHG